MWHFCQENLDSALGANKNGIFALRADTILYSSVTRSICLLLNQSVFEVKYYNTYLFIAAQVGHVYQQMAGFVMKLKHVYSVHLCWRQSWQQLFVPTGVMICYLGFKPERVL